MGETDKLVRMPLNDLRQVLVAAAGDEADRAQAIFLHLCSPAVRLLFVRSVSALRRIKAPGGAPLAVVIHRQFPRHLRPLFAQALSVPLAEIRSPLDDPAALRRKMHVKVDDLEPVVHAPCPFLIACRLLARQSMIAQPARESQPAAGPNRGATKRAMLRSFARGLTLLFCNSPSA